jgi:hypothetical protein
MPARIALMAITTSNSIRVKARIGEGLRMIWVAGIFSGIRHPSMPVMGTGQGENRNGNRMPESGWEV